MGTVTLRLVTLTPEDVAEEVLRAVLVHRAGFGLRLAPAIDRPDPETALAALRDELGLPAAVALEQPAARQLVARALARGWRAAMPDDPEGVARAVALGSDLGLTVQQLAGYALRGDLGDWPDPTCVHDAVQTVCEVLRASPADHLETTRDLDDGDEPEGAGDPLPPPRTRIGIVCRAALARTQIAGDRPVSQDWLAALGGVIPRAIRASVAEGRLEAVKARRGTPTRDRGRVTPASARAWLATRGVPGYEEGSRRG